MVIMDKYSCYNNPDFATRNLPEGALPGNNRFKSHRRSSLGRAYIGLLIGLTVTVLIVVLGQLTWPNYLELKLLDLRHRYFPAPQIHPDVVVLAIDDKSLVQIGRWPWPRRYLGYMIDLCRQANAHEVVLDFQLPDEQSRLPTTNFIAA